MKIYFYKFLTLNLLWLCIGLATISCTPKKYTENLDFADSVLDLHPDSALMLLKVIDPSTISNKEEKARYTLLLSLATLKGDYTSEESLRRADSIFRPAFEYYKDKTNPSRENMLAHFTEAYLQDSDIISIKEYDKAIELAHQLGEWNYVALSYLNKALVYHSAFSSDDELQCIAEAQKISHHVTLPYIKIFAAESAGEAYFSIEDMKNAEKYFKEMLDLAEEASDSAYTFQAYKKIASIYSAQGKYKESMEILQPLLSDSTFIETLQPNEMVYYAETLLYSGHKEEAKKLIDRLKDYQDSSEGVCYYSALAMFSAFEDDYKKVYEFNDSLMTYNNALITEKIRFNLLHQEKEYDQKIAELNKVAYQRKYLIILLSSLSLTLVLGILLLCHRLRIKNMEKDIVLKEEENNRLSQRLNELNYLSNVLEGDLKESEEKLKASEQQLAALHKEKKAMYHEKRTIENELRSKSTNLEYLIKKLEVEKAAYNRLEEKLNNDLSEQRHRIDTLKKEKGENLLAMTRTEAKLLNNWLNTPIAKNEKKIEVIIEKYKDKALHQTIEKTINDSSEGLIDFITFTLQMKPEWIQQVILDICGFNYISTARILSITPSNASARKTRIKHKLLEVTDEEKSTWLTANIPMLQ